MLKLSKKILDNLPSYEAKDYNYNIYVVLPPMKSLEENYRAELSRCPSLIRERIKKADE